MIRRPQEGMRDTGFSLPEIVLVSGFLLYPAVLVVLTKLIGSGHVPLYGWPAIFGLVLGAMYLVGPVCLISSSAAYFLLALLIGFAYRDANDIWKLHNATPTRLDHRWTSLAELSPSQPGIPVVIGSPLV